jgi:hypothetical protein
MSMSRSNAWKAPMPIHLRPSTVSLIKKWHVDGANAQSSRLPTGALGKSTPLWIVCALGQESCDVGEAAACTDRLPDERLPTEIRATASAFCYHQGAIFGGFVPLICRRSLARGSAASPGPRRHFTGPRPKTRFWCPIWSAPETGRARPVGGGERRNARAA